MNQAIATFAFCAEKLHLIRVGNEYAVVFDDGSVLEHRTWRTKTEATAAAIRVSNLERASELCNGAAWGSGKDAHHDLHHV